MMRQNLHHGKNHNYMYTLLVEAGLRLAFFNLRMESYETVLKTALVCLIKIDGIVSEKKR